MASPNTTKRARISCMFISRTAYASWTLFSKQNQTAWGTVLGLATGPLAQELQIPTCLTWLFAQRHCTSAFTIAAQLLMDSIAIIEQSAWTSISLPLSTRRSRQWTVGILIGGRFMKRMNNESFTTSIFWNSPPGTCHTIISARQLYVLARKLLLPSIANVKGGSQWAKAF